MYSDVLRSGHHKRGLIGLIVAMATLFAVATMARLAKFDYDHALEHAATRASAITTILDQRVQLHVESSDQALLRTLAVVQNRLPSQLSQADIRQLAAIARSSPHVDGLFLFDANGDLVASSEADMPAFSVADRDYFERHKSGERDLYIGQMVVSRLPDRALRFTISRPLLDRKGGFVGVTVAALSTAPFDSFLRSVGLGEQDVAALYTLDGRLVMRPGAGPDMIGVDLRPVLKLFEELPKAPTGNYRTLSKIDGVDRIHGYRQLDGLPLVITTGISVEHVLADWLRHQAGSSAVVLVLVAVLNLCIVYIFRRHRRDAALADELNQLLKDREVLFREVHHRVKNNMQVIASMISMQILQSPDDQQRQALQEIIDRIHSMALVHQTLYLRDEVAAVQMQPYLQSVAESLDHSYGASERGIAIEVDAEAATIPLEQSIPVGLIVNELVTNALKHAFPGRRGRIQVRVRRVGAQMTVEVQDDGVGMPASLPRQNSIGMHLIRSLSRQLSGVAEWAGAPGTRFRLSFALE